MPFWVIQLVPRLFSAAACFVHYHRWLSNEWVYIKGENLVILRSYLMPLASYRLNSHPPNFEDEGISFAVIIFSHQLEAK